MPETMDAFLAGAMRGEVAPWSNEWTDLEAIWARIEFHGIALILAERLEALTDWPALLREAIREEAQVQVFWEESHKGALAAVLTAMQEQAISSRIMKGSALAYSVYANAAVRRRGDTDLLVREADLAKMRAVLKAQGWVQRDDPHGLFFQETWLHDTGFGMIHAMDLHWQPNDSPALQQVLRIDEYFAGEVALDRLGVGAKAPDPVLTFVQGAMNQAWHRAKGYFVGEERVMGGHRLIWSLDSHLLAQSFGEEDWARLATLGIGRDVAAIVLAALDAARRDLDAQIPDAVIQSLKSAPQETALTRYLTHSDQRSEFLTDLVASKGLGAKAHFIIANAFPARRHLHWKYPQATSWPTPLLHMRRLAGIVVRGLGLGAR